MTLRPVFIETLLLLSTTTAPKVLARQRRGRSASIKRIINVRVSPTQVALDRVSWNTLFSSTILIVLVLMESVTVKGSRRAMHHRHVGASWGRRGRRIRCRRQQRRTLKTNDQWKCGRGAQAHRVASTFRHRAISRRPRWPRKRFSLQVHTLKKSNKVVETLEKRPPSFPPPSTIGPWNVLRDLMARCLVPILLPVFCVLCWYFRVDRFYFSWREIFSRKSADHLLLMSLYFVFFLFFAFSVLDEVRGSFERNLATSRNKGRDRWNFRKRSQVVVLSWDMKIY